MAKQDFPPILDAGIHKLSVPELEDIAVLAFPTDVRRASLFIALSKWLDELKALGIIGTIWIDGSFITEKPNPDDIDCFMFNASMTRQLSNEEILRLEKLLSHDEARAIFNLDLYVEAPLPEDIFHRQAYWSGVFGFQHDRSKAKGFVEIVL